MLSMVPTNNFRSYPRDGFPHSRSAASAGGLRGTGNWFADDRHSVPSERLVAAYPSRVLFIAIFEAELIRAVNAERRKGDPYLSEAMAQSIGWRLGLWFYDKLSSRKLYEESYCACPRPVPVVTQVVVEVLVDNAGLVKKLLQRLRIDEQAAVKRSLVGDREDILGVVSSALPAN